MIVFHPDHGSFIPVGCSCEDLLNPCEQCVLNRLRPYLPKLPTIELIRHLIKSR